MLTLFFFPSSGQRGDAAGSADDQEDSDCRREAHRTLQTCWGDLFSSTPAHLSLKHTDFIWPFKTDDLLLVNPPVSLSGPWLPPHIWRYKADDKHWRTFLAIFFIVFLFAADGQKGLCEGGSRGVALVNSSQSQESTL